MFRSAFVFAVVASSWGVACVSTEEPANEASGGSSSSGGSAGSAAVAGSAGTTGDTAGSGGSGGSAGATTMAACATTETASGTSPLLTDFESMTAPTGTYTFESAGLLGGTYIYTDTEAPASDPSTSELAFTEGHDETSTQALLGQIHNATWGGGVGFWFTCVDVSVYQGITFWAKGSSPAGDVGLLLSANAVELESKGGSCPDAGPCVRPSLALEVTEEWQQFSFTWDDFAPGEAAGTEVPASGEDLYGIEFTLPNDNMSRDLELAIDDISFIE